MLERGTWLEGGAHGIGLNVLHVVGHPVDDRMRVSAEFGGGHELSPEEEHSVRRLPGMPLRSALAASARGLGEAPEAYIDPAEDPGAGSTLETSLLIAINSSCKPFNPNTKP